MKITFLGTSHGAPEVNRRCSCTLIEIGDNRYIIDMGMQAIEELINKNLPINSVKAVFITHLHRDHTDGLVSFIGMCNNRYKEANAKFYIPGDCEKVKTALQLWLECNGNKMRYFDFNKVEAGLIYSDEVIKVYAYTTLHTENSYAFLIEAEGKRVLFSGDLKWMAPDLPIEVINTPLDLAVLECAHFEATKYIPYFENNKNVKKICINHYSQRFYGTIQSLIDSLPNIDISITVDNMEVNL